MRKNSRKVPFVFSAESQTTSPTSTRLCLFKVSPELYNKCGGTSNHCSPLRCTISIENSRLLPSPALSAPTMRSEQAPQIALHVLFHSDDSQCHWTLPQWCQGWQRRDRSLRCCVHRDGRELSGTCSGPRHRRHRQLTDKRQKPATQHLLRFFETFTNNSLHIPGNSTSGVLRSLLKQSLKSVEAISASIRFVFSVASLASLLKDCRINSADSAHAS